MMTIPDRFVQESDRIVRVDVDGGVWLKPGAAVAYRGDLRFERLATLEAATIKDAAFRELSPVVRAIGKGRLYCAHQGAHVRIIRLAGETLRVVADDLVAFEDTLAFETGLVGRGVGLAAGGMITVRLAGHGAIALASHGEPLRLEVQPGDPLSTDPHATIGWSGGLAPSLKTDLSWRTLVKHGGQEPVQMFFEGSGYVLVQPYEHARRMPGNAGALKKIASALA